METNRTMADVGETGRCPGCGRVVLSNSPHGLCTRCLYLAMLDTPLPDGAAGPGAGGGVRGGNGYQGTAAVLPRAFAGYELEELVARGGMGIVYRARQVAVNRVVALKVLAAGSFAGPDFLERFRTEAEAAASLSHPNIVPIYEVGESEGQPFFSMRFVPGGTLAARLAAGGEGGGGGGTGGGVAGMEDERAVASLVARVAYAIHYAHQRGILHRDIKPGNILMGPEGEPLLTDFGLAKLVEKESTLTRTSALLGTPSYMAPEQARGEARGLTTAVDVYGLGAVLYELLTGQPPFAAGTTMETVRQVLEREPRRPSAIRRGVDRDLETIALKCLAKSPSGRYGSAEALALDLERWLRKEPILARPVSGLERAAKWVRRRPLAAFLLGVTLLAVVATLGILTAANTRIREARAMEIGLRRQAEARAEESRQRLVRLNVNTGSRLVDEGDWYPALPWFVEALKLEASAPVRSPEAEDIHRRRLGALIQAAPRLEQFWRHDRFANVARFSPDTRMLASGGADAKVLVWDLTTGRPAGPALVHSNEVSYVCFLPDGRRLLSNTRERKVQVWEIASGRQVAGPFRVTGGTERSVELSPASRRLLLLGSEGVTVLDLETLRPVRPPVPMPGRPDQLAVSSDGTIVAVAEMGRKEVRLYSASTWEALPGGSLVHPSGFWAMRFSPDGRYLGVSTADLKLTVWEVRTARQAAPPFAHGSVLTHFEFSPDGRMLASSEWRNAAHLWDVQAGRRVGAPLPHDAGVGRVRFSPDGQSLLTVGGATRIWDVATGQLLFPPLRHGGHSTDGSWSPDGSRVVTTGQDGTVRDWALPGRGVAALELSHTGAVASASFHPDGRAILTGGEDGTARVWARSNGVVLAALAHRGRLQSCQFTPDGRRVVTVCEDRGLRSWDWESGREAVPVMVHPKAIRGWSLSPDGRRAATAGSDGAIRVWDLTTGTEQAFSMRHDGPARQVSFSPDGAWLVSAGEDRAARIWDLRTGQAVAGPLVHPVEVSTAVFSPDSRRVVTACADRTRFPCAAYVWDRESGRLTTGPLWHRDGLIGAVFSPDGTRVASHGEDGVGLLWNLGDGRQVTAALSHRSYVDLLRFSPDGRLILTGSSDQSARVWSAAGGDAVTPPLLHRGPVVAGEWSPDGREVITGSVDGTVRVWSVSPLEDPIPELQRRAEILSARSVRADIGAVPIEASALLERWESGRHESSVATGMAPAAGAR